MSSIIKVNTFQDANGNALFSSDGSGNVTTSASGLQNTPSFFAYKTSNQSVSEGVFTKITFQNSVYDTDSAFTTNNKFTVPSGQAGKYYFQSSIRGTADGGTMEYIIIRFYKNGVATYTSCQIQTALNQLGNSHIFGSVILDLNAADYVETYVSIGGDNPNVGGGSTAAASYFGGYKLIGA